MALAFRFEAFTIHKPRLACYINNIKHEYVTSSVDYSFASSSYTRAIGIVTCLCRQSMELLIELFGR